MRAAGIGTGGKRRDGRVCHWIDPFRNGFDGGLVFMGNPYGRLVDVKQEGENEWNRIGIAGLAGPVVSRLLHG